jgi:type II secretory ATPase GspE/PulE/Tfp pilus assembly ATPase PilB-like protein
MDNDWKGRTLGSILFDSRLIGEADIERALEEQKRSGVRFGDALVKLGLVSREDVNWGLAHQFNIPFVRIQNELIDMEAVRITPEETARRRMLLPYLLIGDELTVVVEDPTDRRAIAELEAITGKRVIVGVGLPEQIEAALDVVYGPAGVENRGADLQSDIFSAAESAAMVADATGELFVDGLLAAAVDRRAASVHFDAQSDRVAVRFRVGGEMAVAAVLSRAWMHAVNRRLKSMLRHTDKRAGALEGLLPFNRGDRELFFQASFVDTLNGESIVLANLDAPEVPDALEAFGLDDATAAALAEMLGGRRGLVAVTGPESAAKQKFLKLLADAPALRNRKRVAVGRLPQLADADLIQLSPRAGRFAPLDALAAAAALDPDVLVIEDLMDAGVLAAALKEGAGSRLALGMLRLPTLSSGLEYLLERTESRVLLCEALRGLLSFHLARVLHSKNSAPDDRWDYAARVLRIRPAEAKGASLRRATGRAAAGDRWLPLVGLLPLDTALAALIKSGATAAQIVDARRSAAQSAFTTRLRDLAMRGEIGLDDYLAAVGSPNDGAA